MRVRPSLAISLGIFVAYTAIVCAVWAINDVDYDTFSDSVAGVKETVVLPIGLGALFLIAVTTALGWWRSALFESRRVGPSWAAAVLPGILALAIIVNLGTPEWSNISTGFIVWSLIGVAFVGFSEELVTRGLWLVGAREQLSERMVWVTSSAVFALLHGVNVIFGQSAGVTIQQMVFAFVLGMTFYVTRRVTGTLIVTMVIHGLYDFSVFVNDNTDTDPYGIFPFVVAVLLAIYLLGRISKEADPGPVAGSASPGPGQSSPSSIAR